jgi:hypothetical protein
MKYNFTKASLSKEENAKKIADINTDMLNYLNSGGVTALDVAAKWRGDAAALVREVMIDEFRMMDPTEIFTERRTGTMGDSYEYEKLINTLRSVEYSPGSQPQIFTPRKTKYGIRTSQFELAWGVDLQKVMNRQLSLGDFATMAAQALLRHYQNLVLTAVNAACATGVVDQRGRAVRTAAAGSNVAKPELDAALRRIIAGNGGNATIFGMRFALDPVFDMGATASGDLTKDELNNRGIIGKYRGADIVEMTDEYNEFYQAWGTASGLDLEKLLFISSGVKGAILLERDVSALAWENLDTQKATWSQGQRIDQGILVHTPARYHVVQMA